jgi:hypothetical protein
MVSSEMLSRVALVRTDVSEELSASIIRMIRIGELGTKLTVTSNRRTLRRNTKSPILATVMVEALSSSETSILTRAARFNVPQDAILHRHRRENLKSYRYRFGFRGRAITVYSIVDLAAKIVGPPAVMRHSLKHVNQCEESIGRCDY